MRLDLEYEEVFSIYPEDDRRNIRFTLLSARENLEKMEFRQISARVSRLA